MDIIHCIYGEILQYSLILLNITEIVRSLFEYVHKYSVTDRLTVSRNPLGTKHIRKG